MATDWKKVRADLEEIVERHIVNEHEQGYASASRTLERARRQIVNHIMSYAEDIMLVLTKHGIEPRREE